MRHLAGQSGSQVEGLVVRGRNQDRNFGRIMRARSKSKHVENVCHYCKKKRHIRAYCYYLIFSNKVVGAIERGKQHVNSAEADVVKDGQN